MEKGLKDIFPRKDVVKMLSIIYVVLFSIAFLQRLGNSTVNYFIKYAICIFWLVIILIYSNTYKIEKKEYTGKILFYLKMFIVPVIFIGVYSLSLYIFRAAEFRTFGRFISEITTMTLTVVVAFATLYVFGKRTLKYTILAIISSFLIVILYNWFNFGFDVFINVFKVLFDSTNVHNVFEVHDLTFAAGLVMISYLFFSDKLQKREFFVVLSMTIIILMGFKRIQFLSIVLILAYILILKLFNYKYKNIIYKLTGYLTVLGCYIYVYIIKSGILNKLVIDYNLNTMGRNDFYNWISKHFEFNIIYPGIGLGATSKMMQLDTNWPIATIHSDILRIFVEIGFIAFGVWAIYYLIYCYNRILNKYNIRNAEHYLVLTLYLFILHFTDNTINYFVTQYTYIILVVVNTINNKDNVKNDYENIGMLNSKYFSFISKSIMKIKDKLLHAIGTSLFYVFRLFPIKENKVAMVNYYGNGFSDNPKQITLELLKQDYSYDIVWLMKEDLISELPNKVRRVSYGTLRYIYELATAKVWVDNYRKESYIRKRNNQVYIQTWHGGLGIKKIEGDVEESLGKKYIKMAKNDSKMVDLLISNSVHLTNIYKRAFWYSGEIYECGYPKNDILFKSNSDALKKVKEHYNLSKETNILVYAPTFREDESLRYYNINFDLLNKTLKEKTKKEWVILVRLHPTFRKYNNFIDGNKNIIDATLYPDMEELAMASSIFISDYSSCMFDAEMRRIPTFIYASDKDDYMNERGFYFKLEQLPFPIATNNEELMNNILNFDINDYYEKLDVFNEMVGIKEYGEAAKKVANKINSFIKKGCL